MDWLPAAISPGSEIECPGAKKVAALEKVSLSRVLLSTRLMTCSSRLSKPIPHDLVGEYGQIERFARGVVKSKTAVAEYVCSKSPPL
jgi:hypothetical protein